MGADNRCDRHRLIVCFVLAVDRLQVFPGGHIDPRVVAARDHQAMKTEVATTGFRINRDDDRRGDVGVG